MYNYPPSGHPDPGQQPPGYAPYGYPPPQRRRPWLPWVIGGGALFAVIIAVFAAVLVFVGSNSNHGVKITYQVEGTGNSIEVTYTGRRDNEHVSNVSLPWTTSVTVGSSVVFASLMVTSADPDARFTCRILADGKQVTQEGPGSTIVSCFGSTGNKWAPG